MEMPQYCEGWATHYQHIQVTGEMTSMVHDNHGAFGIKTSFEFLLVRRSERVEVVCKTIGYA